VFTARYALNPYIKQIRFVFKGLIKVINFQVPSHRANEWRSVQSYANIGLFNPNSLLWSYVIYTKQHKVFISFVSSLRRFFYLFRWLSNILYLNHSSTKEFILRYICGKKKHHFKYLFVYKFVFIAHRAIASVGTHFAVRGVDQHWYKVEEAGVYGGSYLHGTALPYTLCFVITRNSLSLSLSVSIFLLEVSRVFACHLQTFSPWNSLPSLRHLWSFIPHIWKTSCP
jgi:hypothetical protein